MKKLMKKKVSMFGKEFSVFAVAVVSMMVMVSAALLPYYGLITGSAVVSQSVTINGQDYNDAGIEGAWNSDFVAGESVTDCDGGTGYNLKNNADVEATIVLGTTCEDTNASTDDCEGVTTEIYGVLELENKDGSWNLLIGDNTRATLHYSVVGEQFKYELEATGLVNEKDYVLIYYADQPGRYTNWGGAPALNLGTFTSSTDGSLDVVESSNIPEGLLPYPTDWNTGTIDSTDGYADYCNNVEDDNYKHCTGAKIWLVLADDYNGVDTVLTYNPTAWLFETDLIVYSDSSNGAITLPAGGGFDFCVENNFALNLVPDTYTITTTVDTA